MEYLTSCLSRLRAVGWGLAILLVLGGVGVYGGFAPAGAVTLGPADGEGLAPTDLERVKVGDPAPDFTLAAEDGTPVTLSQFRGHKHVILVFYRGHW